MNRPFFLRFGDSSHGEAPREIASDWSGAGLEVTEPSVGNSPRMFGSVGIRCGVPAHGLGFGQVAAGFGRRHRAGENSHPTPLCYHNFC